jgi:hypothetical protein
MQSQGPELRGSNITLEKIIAPTDLSKRQTKIICTLGPACWNVKGPNQLEELIGSGLSVARFNFSHGDHEAHKACLDRLREASANTGKHVGKSHKIVVRRCRRRHTCKRFSRFICSLYHRSFCPSYVRCADFDRHFGSVQLHDTNKRQSTGQLGLEYWIILQHYFYCVLYCSSTIQ